MLLPTLPLQLLLLNLLLLLGLLLGRLLLPILSLLQLLLLRKSSTEESGSLPTLLQAAFPRRSSSSSLPSCASGLAPLGSTSALPTWNKMSNC